MAGGAALFDYDNDGWLDIFLVDGGSMANQQTAGRARHRLYRNRRNGTFEDVTSASGIQHRGYGMGVCAGDYDATVESTSTLRTSDRTSLYRNRGDGTFSDVSRAARVDASEWSTQLRLRRSRSATATSICSSRTIWMLGISNNPFCGDERAQRRAYCHPLGVQAAAERRVPERRQRHVHGCQRAVRDCEVQGQRARRRGRPTSTMTRWPDVFVANDALPNFLFFNEGGWRFTEGGLARASRLPPTARRAPGMGTDAADYDGDGLVDLVVTNHEFETTSLFRNLGGRLFAYVTGESGIAAPTRPFVGFGVVFTDYDNDGALDLAIVNGHVMDNARAPATRLDSRAAKAAVPQHAGRGVSSKSERSPDRDSWRRRSAAVWRPADIDNDGDQDLLVTNNGGPVELLRNDGGSSQNSLLIQLVGRTSNREGIGARVRLTSGWTDAGARGEGGLELSDTQ